MKRLIIPIILALFASCDSDRKEKPQSYAAIDEPTPDAVADPGTLWVLDYDGNVVERPVWVLTPSGKERR